MNRIFRLLPVLLLILITDTFSQYPTVLEIINTVRQDSLVYFVRQLSGDMPVIVNGIQDTIFSRHSYRPGNEIAANYIKQKFESYGLNTILQHFDVNGYNVIAEQIGVEFPNVKYIICAHYDDMPTGLIAPGADDNASGTAAVIEAARIFSQYNFPITIIYAAWDEEEQGLIGSSYYASQAAQAGDSILGVINLDMISYDSNYDGIATINVYPIGYTLLMGEKIVEINDIYNIGLNLQTINPGSGGSDHVAFWLNNYSAVFFFQDPDNRNIYYHTVYDNVQHINQSYFYKYAKLGIGSLTDLCLGSIYFIIMPVKPYIDKTYARKNIDSVLFLTRFNNVYNHTFNSNLIYVNDDNSQVDSLALFDDGMHGDSLSGDGIYGRYIPVQDHEDFFNINVSTVDEVNDDYFLMNNLAYFTTAGPVKLDSLLLVKDMFNWYNLKPFVTNIGEDMTITDAEIRLKCSDPWVVAINPMPINLPSMAPGESVWATGWTTLEYDEATFPGYFNIEADIMKNEKVLWTDEHMAPVGVEETKLPDISFSLEQNYPNPFNPSTKIQYSIPKMSLVTLKIFDILGNEVAVIVNDIMPAGIYMVSFDGSSISSGIYFYRLMAGSYTATRKMVLLR